VIHPLQFAKVYTTLSLRGSPEWLKWTCCHCSWVGGIAFHTFSIYDTDLDPMTFRYELDTHSPEDVPAYEKKVSGSMLSKVKALHRYRHSTLCLNVKCAD